MVSQMTSLAIVYSTVYSGADQRTLQCSVSLAFVRGIHRWPVNSPHKWPVTREKFHLMTSLYAFCIIGSCKNHGGDNLQPGRKGLRQGYTFYGETGMDYRKNGRHLQKQGGSLWQGESDKIDEMFCIVIMVKSWWRHQMETFSALLAICTGNSPVTGEFPTQKPVT